MAIPTDRRKASLIKQVIALADKKAAAKDRAVFKRFIEQFFADCPPDDMAGKSQEHLYAAVKSAWDFLQSRPPGKPKIRFVTPSQNKSKNADWADGRTVLEIINDDMPFLVDSVTAELERVGEQASLLIHPVMPVKRDAAGKLRDVCREDEPYHDEKAREKDGVTMESVMQIQIPLQTNPDMLERMSDTLTSVLGDVRRAVTDWLEMRRQATRIAADFDGAPPGLTADQASEVEDFLHWLHDDHYTFLGYRRFDFTTKGKTLVLNTDHGANLGVLSKRSLSMFEGVQDDAPVPPQFKDFLNRDSVLLIVKANLRATVHRRVHYDIVAIKIYDDNGKVVGAHLFAGLFTADVYTNSPNFVPVLKRKIERIRDAAGFRKHSHDGKALQNIMENLPRDELFESDDAYLLSVALGILHLQERSRTALFVRRDDLERFVSCLVYVPRDRFDTQLRLAITDILVKAYSGRLSSFFTQVTDSPLARIHFIVATVPGKTPQVDTDALEEKIAAAARVWQDDLKVVLTEKHGESEGVQLHGRYAYAFPASYREHFSCERAVFDIDKIEDLIAGRKIAMHLYESDEGNGQVHFKVFAAGQPLTLSDVIPVIENMGFKVIGEVPYQVTPQGSAVGGGPIWIHDFDMTVASGQVIEVEKVREDVHEAFERVWNGEMESDGFNRLVALASLKWREVVILRAYAKYLRQAAFPVSQSYIEDAFSAHPGIARLLVNLFAAQFDPATHKGKSKTAADKKSASLKKSILAALDEIKSAEEDRILRRYLNLIGSSLRTNFFQTCENGLPKSYLSIKLNSQTVDDLPKPRPWREIFVYSPRVEAIHLRGGPVARGGLRWSDRREDFRSEVLGLVKAQMVKNAVIVPTGSKGGFVVKNPPASGGRDAFQAEGIACYQIMQRGLLDITDNVINDKVKPPKNVVRRDTDDPYLVVAADKGTATFSDIANAISENEYGHWLGDAYASGGGYGYDHKAMGITAKGAWESVKRHFREMGLNTQKENFTVVGVGDMSGDVFGNGMLLSKHIKLVAAFNHMHIFIDPNPDPAAGWKERKRMFKLPRSAWTDYDAKLISKGGGVFERSAKSLKLSAEIRNLLGLNQAEATPDQVITAILKAEADLMWFGGIGTYIKAEGESHADAADRANDGIRINAEDVRVKVIGEGANLGVTQRGRIECGQHGVRLNTDAIDNSAGVDCSDHEVNIKILLNGLVATGKLSKDARNKLLEDMTNEVSELVLRDNYQQTQTISFVSARAAEVMEAQHRAMKMMEREGLLDRAIEFLPDDEEIAERISKGQGLTRPEIAVLLPYSKMWLYEKLVKSNLPDDPLLEDDLITYFPEPIQKKYLPAIKGHKLRREIIATVATNSFVNRVGASFLTSMIDRTGVGPVDVVRAYLVTRAAYNLRDIWNGIEALDNKIDASVQIDMLNSVYRMIERSVLWLLRNESAPINVGAAINRLTPAVDEVKKSLRQVISADVAGYIDELAGRYVEQGVPKALADDVASLYRIAAANDIERIAQISKLSVRQASEVYFRVGARFGLGWLRNRTEVLARGSHWQKLAVSAAVEELFAQQTQISIRVIGKAGSKNFHPGKALEKWTAANLSGVERFDSLMDELRASGDLSLAMLTVTNRQLAAMCPTG